MKRSADPLMSGDDFRPAESLVRALRGAPIAVGTQNPAKLEAIRLALAGFAEPDAVLDLIPVEVASGVSEQPIGFEEILCGARNRARAAFEKSNATLAVGIEDGLMRYSQREKLSAGPHAVAEDALPDAFYNVGCAWVMDAERAGHGFSAGFAYPPGCREPALREQRPIGDLFDELWRLRREEPPHPGPDGARNQIPAQGQEPASPVASGRQGGNIGLLTQGRLDRAAYGSQAVTCALIRFLHTDLYD